MKSNVGNMDRVIRGSAGAALFAAGLLAGLEAPLNYVCMGAGGVFMVTALLKFCPLYPIFGINTCSNKSE